MPCASPAFGHQFRFDGTGHLPAVMLFVPPSGAQHVVLRDDAVDDADLDSPMDLRPFMNPVPVTVQLQCPLSRVFTLFRSLGMRHLVVTDLNNEVQGIISRQTIMSSFQQDLF